MDTKIKSGKDILNDFLAEIYNIPNTDKKTIDTIVELHFHGKLSEKSIQNALDVNIQRELKQIDQEDE